ncbi:hypothetical protein Srufu_010820 [Streptomyces libani subsp. rufus]|nr:hypothetical protein Srufu_010820 [Streptomyces libani subsp. rufus]
MTGRPPTDAEPPLLIACALGIERFALRRGGRGGAAGEAGPRVVTLRTGMGPQAAERALAEALRAGSVTERSPVIASGFCAGLAPGCAPGTWSSPRPLAAITPPLRRRPAVTTARCSEPCGSAV